MLQGLYMVLNVSCVLDINVMVINSMEVIVLVIIVMVIFVLDINVYYGIELFV